MFVKWSNFLVQYYQLEIWSITILCTQEQKASQGTTNGEVFDSRKSQEDDIVAALKYVCRLIPHKYKPVIRLDIVLRESEESCLVV